MTDDNTETEAYTTFTLITRIPSADIRHFIHSQYSRDLSISRSRHFLAMHRRRRVFKQHTSRAQGSRRAARHVSKIRHGSN